MEYFGWMNVVRGATLEPAPSTAIGEAVVLSGSVKFRQHTYSVAAE